ncbi:hypothetical protein DUI87_13525 [Hirundo rustica rustica]|uniref:Endonuclease/exonuclease/phosphatase domain-containing protein n=1 Tax=Hirundo rustica rustica TaxID=333673 RepID=A0A3M0K978_HIRRU|nr:hypothetical protein DUI87_13525 [Hirundo rustica rustica]
MKNKQEKLKDLAESQRYDIIGISETWWDESCDWSAMIEGLVSEMEIHDCLGHNDHEAIKFKICVDRRKSASKTATLDMRRADFRLLRELVSKDENGHLTNRDMNKAEVFKAFFAFVFNPDDGPRAPQCPELEGPGFENDKLPVDSNLSGICCSSWIPISL